MLRDELLDGADIGCRPDERYGYHVDAVLQPEFQIDAIFVGESGDAERCPREIDSLVFAEHAAVDHFALHIVVMHLQHSQLDQAIGQQDACAGLDLTGEILEGGRNQRGGAGNVARGDAQARPGFQEDRFVSLQSAGTDLRTLQVLQDTDSAIFFFCSAAQTLNVAGVLRVGAVGKIEAGDVHAKAHQVAHGRL